LTTTDLQEQLGYQQLARVYASLATTALVLDPVVEALDTDESVEELARRVAASTLVDENLVVIEGTGSTPAAAASLAQAVTDSIVALATPEEAVQPAGTAAPTGTAPAGTAAAPVGSLALVIQPAVEDEDPSAPSILFDTLIVAAVGLGLGVIVTMLLTARTQGRREEEWSTLPDSRAYPTGPYSR
jgi:capsular polysaccharide biosynthesis protein